MALGTLLGCPSFSSSDVPPQEDAAGADAAADDGAAGADAASGGGIGLRGRDQFPSRAGSAVVLSAPGATQPDDMIWVALGVEGDFRMPTVTLPAGFVARGSRGIQGPPGCSVFYAYYSLRAAVAGPVSFEFQVTAVDAAATPVTLTGLLVSYFGVDPATPIDDAHEGAVGSEAPDSGTGPFGFTTTTVTTTVPNAQLLFFVGLGGAGGWVEPATGPERVTDTNVLAVFAQTQPVPGKTVPQRFLNNNPKCGEFAAGDVNIIALRPAQ